MIATKFIRESEEIYQKNFSPKYINSGRYSQILRWTPNKFFYGVLDSYLQEVWFYEINLRLLENRTGRVKGERKGEKEN